MDSATRRERDYLRMVEELRACDSIVVFDDLVGAEDLEGGNLGRPLSEQAAEVRSLTQGRPGWDGVTLDPEIEQCGLRFPEIGSQWATVKGLPRLSGEFRLPMFYDALFAVPPRLAQDGSTGSAVDYTQLREIDGHPQSGTGFLAAVRVQPHTSPLEIWVWSPEVGPKRMDLDYCGYLDALLITKGAYGWQYLFTDVSLADDLFHQVVSNVEVMLGSFPELFPDYDYAPLAARLEARL
ncbi:hypothetical protein GCM10011428_53120 [Streptomyces violaceus]